MTTPRPWSTASVLVAAGRPAGIGDPLNVPLVPASNFHLGGDHAYARDEGTPTWAALEAVVGRLEGGDAVAFSSGMAAVAAVLEQATVGATLVLPDDCYQGVTGLAEVGERRHRWHVRRLAVDDTDGWIAAAGDADVLWVESPSNPLLQVADVAAICAAPRRPGAIVAVDNTFATPLNQQPLGLGADVVVHSATKYLGGHSDLLAGVAVTDDPELHRALTTHRTLSGATPGTLEAYLAVRGLRTLAVRLQQSQRNAGALAERLAGHRAVEVVRYPGLPAHPGHHLAAAQLAGFGSIVSFDVAGGATAADAVCTGLELIRHATSLGAVESTIERRAAIPGQQHLPPGLLRLSVGIEDVDDLWSDLSRALDVATRRATGKG